MNNVYSGTITQTITSTNDPRLNVGNQYVGAYEYQAPTTDGKFCHGAQWGLDQTLQGFVYCYFPATPGFKRSISNCSNGGYITVSNGLVTDFHCDDESGYLGMGFSFSAFSFKGNLTNDVGQESQFNTCGTLQFSKPILAPPSPPTSANVTLNIT